MAKVFISHSTVDKPFVRRLQLDLELMGTETWIDEEKIFAGNVLDESLEEGILSCTHFLIVISPNSIKSDWVKREINKAISLFGRKNIIPVVYRKADIPSELNGLIYVDFSDIIFFLNNDMTIANYHGPEYPEKIKKVMTAILNSDNNPPQIAINKVRETKTKIHKAKPATPGFSTPVMQVQSKTEELQVTPAPIIKSKVGAFASEQKKNQLIEIIAKKHPQLTHERNLTPVIFPAELRNKFDNIHIGDTIIMTSDKRSNNRIAAHFCGFASNIDYILLPDEIRIPLNIQSQDYIWLTINNTNTEIIMMIHL